MEEQYEDLFQNLTDGNLELSEEQQREVESLLSNLGNSPRNVLNEDNSKVFEEEKKTETPSSERKQTKIPTPNFKIEEPSSPYRSSRMNSFEEKVSNDTPQSTNTPMKSSSQTSETSVSVETEPKTQEPQSNVEEKPELDSSEDVPEYSEKEVEKLRYLIIKQGLEDVAILQYKIQTMQAELQNNEEKNKELQAVADEYETTILEMISEAGITLSNSVEETVSKLNTDYGNLITEIENANSEIESLNLQIQQEEQTKEKYQKAEADLRKTLNDVENDKTICESKYSSLEEQVEKQLGGANEKIANYKLESQKEVDQLKEELAKQKAKGKSLVEAYSQELKKNKELNMLFNEILEKVSIE